MTTIAPEVLWAQRSNATDETKNVLYVTVKIADAKNTKIDLTSTHLNIESDSDEYSEHYKLALEFYKPIDPENSKHHASGNSIYFVLRKAEKQEEFWPRITKEKLKYHYIKTDFDKWVDEDEQDEKEEEPDMMGGMPPMGAGGAGGFPGMGGAGGAGGMPDLSSLMGGAGGAAGGAPGGFDFSQLANDPNFKDLQGADGQLDFSKLAAQAGSESVSASASGATEADFSSSDEDGETNEPTVD